MIPATWDADTTCRRETTPSVFVYSDSACLASWSAPGTGSAVDFSATTVIDACNLFPVGTHSDLHVEGVADCGDSLVVRVHAHPRCESLAVEGSLSVRLAMPRTDLPVRVDTRDWRWLSQEPPYERCPAITCLGCCEPPPSPAAPGPCWQECEFDEDCTLIETSCCDCANGGTRVPIRAALASAWRYACTGPGDGCDAHYACACPDGHADARAVCTAGRCSIACAPFCVDDHTWAPFQSEGTQLATDCTPYRCAPAGCLHACVSDADCVGGATCDTTGACGAPAM